MSRNMSRAICVWGILLLLYADAGQAFAQWYPGGNPCVCVQPQPVAQVSYQTVPVTEYQQVKRTVSQPVVETKYVDQTVTAYRPVTETRTVSVPTTSYQNVTECQNVTRNMSHWQTQYVANQRLHPYQYDNRRNLFGAMNRVGYRMRSAFTPSVSARRQYVPNVVTQVVPVTRRVAIQGTRQVTYNVTRMEPYTTTRKVAVNSVRYVKKEVVSTQPVTVMRTVPIGSTVSFGYPGIGTATQTVSQPIPDPISAAKSNSPERNSRAPEKYKRASNFDGRQGSATLPHPTSLSDPTVIPQRAAPYAPPVSRSRTVPTVARVSGWTAHRTAKVGPMLISPMVSLAETGG
jgi:hypothetical protein